jgi:hypothetical protein
MTTSESDFQTVDWAPVPDIWTLKMDEKSLVPKPWPETETETDPLPGTRNGETRRAPAMAITMLLVRNTRDFLEAREDTMSIVVWEIAEDLHTMADVARQRAATHDVDPKRKPKDACTVPKFWPNIVTELLPDNAKVRYMTPDTAWISYDNDDDNNECVRSIVTITPAEP